MSLVINHNMLAMNAARNLSSSYNRLSTSVQRLSSGLRINSAADDAAGLAIREMMRADIATTYQGLRNAADAISLIQTADGALSVIDEKLIRMKELAEQAATGTYTTAQREIINSEYQAMAREIDRIANATNFNGVKLLDGSISNQHGGQGLKIHFGVNNNPAEDYYFVNIGDARATTATGLRIGGDAKNDIWGQGAAGAGELAGPGCCTAGFDSLNGQAGFTSGEWFAYGYNWDWQAQNSAGYDNGEPNLLSGKYLAGRYTVGAGESLQDLINKVNAGTQSRVGVEIDASGARHIASGGTVAVCLGDEAYYWGSATAAEGGIQLTSTFNYTLNTGVITSTVNGTAYATTNEDLAALMGDAGAERNLMVTAPGVVGEASAEAAAQSISANMAAQIGGTQFLDVSATSGGIPAAQTSDIAGWLSAETATGSPPDITITAASAQAWGSLNGVNNPFDTSADGGLTSSHSTIQDFLTAGTSGDIEFVFSGIFSGESGGTTYWTTNADLATELGWSTTPLSASVYIDIDTDDDGDKIVAALNAAFNTKYAELVADGMELTGVRVDFSSLTWPEIYYSGSVWTDNLAHAQLAWGANAAEKLVPFPTGFGTPLEADKFTLAASDASTLANAEYAGLNDKLTGDAASKAGTYDVIISGNAIYADHEDLAQATMWTYDEDVASALGFSQLTTTLSANVQAATVLTDLNAGLGGLFQIVARDLADVRPDITIPGDVNFIDREDPVPPDAPGLYGQEVDPQEKEIAGAIDSSKAMTQVSTNESAMQLFNARALASAINNNPNSKFWAMMDNQKSATMLYVFTKEGGNFNDLLACDVAARDENSRSALNFIDFENVEHSTMHSAGTTFSLGGEHWGTMKPTQTKSDKGNEVWNITLNGRDVGYQRDLWIAAQNELILHGIDEGANGIINGMDRHSFVEIQNAANGGWAGADVRTQSNAQGALEALDNSIDIKDKIRADLGAMQNRLQNTMTNLEIQVENLQAAESRISDVDVAKEMTEFTRNNVLTQAAVGMLAQANSLSQLALSLIGR